jgi:hypothetical protein
MSTLYDVDMSTERVTITLDEDVLAYARERAEAEGLSLSAWLNRAAAHTRRVEEGRRAVAETLKELGPISPDVDRWADRLTSAVLAGADQSALDQIWAEYPGVDRPEQDSEAA